MKMMIPFLDLLMLMVLSLVCAIGGDPDTATRHPIDNLTGQNQAEAGIRIRPDEIIEVNGKAYALSGNKTGPILDAILQLKENSDHITIEVDPEVSFHVLGLAMSITEQADLKTTFLLDRKRAGK